MSSARSEILRRVAAALRDVPQHETPADVAVARGLPYPIGFARRGAARAVC
jgi:hypothetical protein